MRLLIVLLFLSLNLHCKGKALSYDLRGVPEKHAEFIKKYHEVAIAECVNHGVPASITMAQAILESGAGTSKMFRQTNNLFGVKAKRNNPLFKRYAVGAKAFSEGDFCVYVSPWWSFRHRSVLLTQGTYQGIRERYGKNYFSWAFQLKARGYAEDRKYPQKLIKLINSYKLYLLDGFTAPLTGKQSEIKY